MKIRLELEPELEEDEVIIRCRQVDASVLRMQQLLLETTTAVQKICLYKGEKEYYFSLKEILFFETDDGKIDAHTRDDLYSVKHRLYELEEMLPRNFVRVSKSTILNIDHILSISRNITSSSLVEFNHTHKQVFVSRSYYKNLKQRLLERKEYEK